MHRYEGRKLLIESVIQVLWVEQECSASNSNDTLPCSKRNRRKQQRECPSSHDSGFDSLNIGWHYKKKKKKDDLQVIRYNITGCGGGQGKTEENQWKTLENVAFVLLEWAGLF